MNKQIILILFISNSILAQTYYFNHKNNNIPLGATSISSMDVESADIDNDGDLDIIIAGEFRRNLLLFNDGTGVFREDATRLFPDKNPNDRLPGEDSEDIAIADFDLDGDLDLIFVSEDTDNHELLINDGTGRFTFISYNFPPSKGEAVAVLDLNNDNYPDIVIGNNGQNQVYINNQDLSFTEDSSRWPTNIEGTQDLKLVDIDGDNDLDIIEGIDSGTNNLLINTNGFFTDESNRLPDIPETIETRKVTLGDINNDGFVDLYYSNINFGGVANMQDRIFLNNGNGYFTDYTDSFPTYVKQTLDAIFVDYDLDGDLDLFSVGYLDPSINYQFFENTGNGIFKEASSDIVMPFKLTAGIALHSADFDGDSYPDIYIGSYQQSDDILFFNTASLGLNSELLFNSIIVYPNPADDTIILKIRTKDIFEKVTVELINAQGQKIQTVFKGRLNFGLNEIFIDIEKQKEGLYFIEILTPKGKISKQIIIR